MAIYAISLQPLVKRLNKQEVKQVWFADDSAACGKLCGLLQWWQQLVAEGPKDCSCSDQRLAYTRSHARSTPVARS